MKRKPSVKELRDSLGLTQVEFAALLERAIALAGGAEVAKAIGFSISEAETKEPSAEPVKDIVHQDLSW